MNGTTIDLKHSLDVLKRINSVRINGKSLKNSFFIDQYNIWQTQQQSIFGVIQRHDFSSIPESSKPRNLSFSFFVTGSLSVFLSIMAFLWLVISRRKVLVYSVDKVHSRFKSDTRLDTVYESLGENNIAYTECLHTLLGKTFLFNLLKRKRFAIYLESLDFIYLLLVKLRFFKTSSISLERTLDLSDFKDKKERLFVINLTEEYVYQAEAFQFKTKMLSKMLNFTSVTHFLTIDDVRYYNELLYACRENGIASYAFQHGLFTKYHVGWLLADGVEGRIIKPDKLFVWSPYWKQELISLGTYFEPSEIVVGGIKNSSDVISQRDAIQHDAINILVPHERIASKVEVMRYIKGFLDCGAKVFFKIRPGVDRSSQLEEYSIEEGSQDNFIVIDDIQDIIDDIDIVAGSASTFLYDMVTYNKPVVYMNTKVDYCESIVSNDLAEFLDINDEICSKLRSFSQVSNEVLEARRRKLFGDGKKVLQNTLEVILEKI